VSRGDADTVDWRTRWTARVGAWVLRAVAMTWRVRYRYDEPLRAARRAGQPVVFTIWHGHILAQLWSHRRQGVSVMISEHRDGEIVARMAESLGYRTVRGSSSRGAVRALASMVREVKAGHDAALTPDGPRGPYHSYAAGALLVSQRTGRPVVPVAAHASRAWVLRSWDRFMIPKPFARVIIAYGEFVPPPPADARALEDEVGRYVQGMEQAAARATEPAT
jgi:lysophospholipid acyltransferase (LPLAT)-like uncharacterized protein